MEGFYAGWNEVLKQAALDLEKRLVEVADANQINDTLTSKKLIIEALLLAKKEKTHRDYIAALKQASIIDVQNASTYSKEYIRLSDSIRNVEILSQEKFARILLETDEIIKEKDRFFCGI